MATVIVTTRDGREHQIPGKVGLSVMEVLRTGGIDDILALCGGCCSCATCHVYVDESFRARLPPMGTDEDDLLDTSGHRSAASRLSCQIPFTAALDGLRLTVAPED